MKVINVSAYVMLLASYSGVTAASQTHWGYDVSEGPAIWGKLSPEYSLCETGRNQSPVNIREAMEAHTGQLQMSWAPVKQEIINNGHTVQINTTKGDTLFLDKHEFTLMQFHF
ncbi:carbonic anhydrase family protein, partial [Escherichia coli]|uniref:carbonic anhydrase family protein n=2 Tax=Enterobacteriaceae TaxID=543 RepID=UPI0032D9CBBF